MKIGPRDCVALILALSIFFHPLVAVAALWWWGKSLTEMGAEALQALQLATIAVLSAYIAGRPSPRPDEPADDL